MKTRHGFVSNSSSSSFVVKFPKVPKSAEDVKNMLFIDQEYYYSPYDNERWTVEEVANTVWSDICDQEKNNMEKAKEILSGGSYDDEDAPNYYEFSINGNIDWDAYNTACDIYADKKMKEFFNNRKLKLKKINKEEVDEVFYCFEYSDSDSSYYSALEHGNLFQNLEYIKVSNH